MAAPELATSPEIVTTPVAGRKVDPAEQIVPLRARKPVGRIGQATARSQVNLRNSWHALAVEVPTSAAVRSDGRGLRWRSPHDTYRYQPGDSYSSCRGYHHSHSNHHAHLGAPDGPADHPNRHGCSTDAIRGILHSAGIFRLGLTRRSVPQVLGKDRNRPGAAYLAADLSSLHMGAMMIDGPADTGRCIC